MKTTITSVCFLLLAGYSFAQQPLPRFVITVNGGVSVMTGLPANTDQQSSRKTGAGFYYNLAVSKKNTPVYLCAGLEYQHITYFADAYFSQPSGNYMFSITPANYKQHELAMQYLQVPLLFKWVPFRETSTGIGLYGGYLLRANSHYKIAGDKFTMKAPVQNRFSAGLVVDEEIIFTAGKNKNTACLVGFAASYQLTQYLSDHNSFKPFGAVIKIGMGF